MSQNLVEALPNQNDMFMLERERERKRERMYELTKDGCSPH
jgi:hypothetical protein